MADQFQRLHSDASFAASEANSTISTQSLVEALSKIPPPKVEVNVDCAVPKQQCLKYEAAGVKKGKEMDFFSTFILAMHAGIFVSFGAGFFTVVQSDTNAASNTTTAISFGVNKFAAGLAFCVGLAMVILCGSELFTGNALLFLAWATKKITTMQVLRNWTIVYIGNFIGSIIMAAIQTWGRTHENANGQVGRQALDIANAKCSREWGQCYCLGILCNIMVCWSVWMTLAAREAASKLLVFILPITAFAAMGFEHCVANMYFLPVALMIKTYATDSFWTKIKKSKADYENVTIGKMIYANIIPATLGNVSGAIMFIGTVYWYLYLRDNDHVSRFEIHIGNTKFFASPPVAVQKKKKKTAA